MGNEDGTSSSAAAAAAAAAASTPTTMGSTSQPTSTYPAPQGPDAYPPPHAGVNNAPYPPQQPGMAAPYPPAPQGYPGQAQAYPGQAQAYPGQPQSYPGQPYGAGYAPPPPAVVQGRPPLVSIISPEDAKKIRKMQWVNFACTMLQLACSVAIILIIRNNLTRIIIGVPTAGSSVGAFWDYDCFAATSAHPSTCEYGISLASVSIFFGFILSLMQCLTMDCCGMGRAVEAGFDAAACAWWIAGAITMGVRASEANAAGVPQGAARNAVVALCWISAVMFGALFITNCILIKRLGRAYKAAAQQMQQHMTAYPATTVQMVPMQAGGPVAVSGGTAFPNHPMPPQQQQQGPPAGYPTAWSPPAATTGPNAV